MLVKPDLPDIKIIDCLRDAYGLNVAQIVFLPIGADRNTAVYRTISDAGTPYFVKLRRDDFDEIAVAVPRLLHDQGLNQIIAPLATRSGALWTEVGDFKLMLYPFVEGRDGYQVALSDQGWNDFGRAFKMIHATIVPPALAARIPREAYSARWRDSVRNFQAYAESQTFSDPISSELAVLIKVQRPVISDLVSRAERLAAALQTQPPTFVLCHSDIHAGNLLIQADGTFYIVDWDNPILAPKERDLMFIGGGQGFIGLTTEQEVALFYQGYGQTHIDPVALAYYRYERIVADIAAYCDQLFISDQGDEDRANGLRQLARQFRPGGVIEVAYQSDK